MNWLSQRFIAVTALATLLGACTPTRLYHAQTDLERVNITSPANGASQTVEVAYVEFSDQGWLQKRDQLEHALALLDDETQKKKRVVVYIHGWQHNADPDDRNVKHFKDVILPFMMDQDHQTIGIYAAWRGKSIEVPGVNLATFYDRKASAEHVARGSVRELISSLRARHNDANALKNREKRKNSKEADERDLQVILIGHSFGGLILYNAIVGSLLDAIVDANHVKNSRRLVKPLADLAIVINPAFEASRFESLFQAAKQRLTGAAQKHAYSSEQFPVFVSITAESDLATQYAFPIGRAVNSLFEHEGMVDEDCTTDAARQLFNQGQWCSDKPYGERLEKIANTSTMGHMERYRTHELSLNGGAVKCTVQTQSPNLVGDVTHFPLWNMYAKGSEVIQGHSGIYDPPLWTFIASLANANARASLETRDGKSIDICQ